MMMSIALRFIPILIEETDKIMKAQMARGADFESGNIIKKAKAMIPILVPLFISAFRRGLMNLQWLWRRDVITVLRGRTLDEAAEILPEEILMHILLLHCILHALLWLRLRLS